MKNLQYPMLISDETDSSIITIGLVAQSKGPLEPSPGERQALEIIYDAISKVGVPPSDISLLKRSKDYLTISIGDFDFCRFKVGPKSIWISLSLWTADSTKLASDPRLAKVKNKNVRHWKIPVVSVSDIASLSDLIQLSCLDAKRSNDQCKNA